MDLSAVTAQLYLLNGQPQETDAVPGLLALSPPPRAARGRDRDYLFVHLTLSGPADETVALSQDLVDAISDRFYGTGGSVTAALRQAIQDTNELLLHRNVSGVDVSREGAITCAVLREQELFMAQVGESFAVLGQNFGLERLPATSPGRVTPLGRTAGIDVRFYHNWLQPGHMLLLADPRMAHLPSDALRQALAESVDLEESLNEFSQLLVNDTARLLLIYFTDDALMTIPRTPVPLPSGARLAPPTVSPRRDPRFLRPESPAAASQPAKAPVSLPQVDLAPTARDASAQAARGLGRLTYWLAELLARLRAPAPAAPAETRVAWAWPAMLAVVIPLIIAVVGATAYVQRGQVERFSSLRQQMSMSIALAQQAPDRATATQFLQEALAYGIAAESLRPGNGDVAAMRLQALDALDRLEGVTRLAAATLYRFDDGTTLRSVVLRAGFNGDLFVLDAGKNEVWRLDTAEDFITLTGDPERVFFGDQAIGSHTVGPLLDMIWRPPGDNVSRENLTAVDRQGAAVSFYPDFQDYRAVPLGLASNWLEPRQITAFGERLYVLDPGTERIWRYRPDGDGFTITEGQESVTFADPPNLGAVVDMAIYSEDGSVILLYANGSLRRFVNGRALWTEVDLMQGGLETPLAAPTAMRISGRGLNSSLFVADPGTSRVVQFSLGGIFLAQYRAAGPTGLEAFAQVTDLAIAETPLRIFVVSGNELIVASEP